MQLICATSFFCTPASGHLLGILHIDQIDHTIDSIAGTVGRILPHCNTICTFF